MPNIEENQSEERSRRIEQRRVREQRENRHREQRRNRSSELIRRLEEMESFLASRIRPNLQGEVSNQREQSSRAQPTSESNSLNHLANQ